MPKCSLTHQKAEQRDFRHAVLSKPYKPVLCAATLTGDSFPKIIVRHDIRKRWYDDNGVLNIGVLDFLLDDTLV